MDLRLLLDWPDAGGVSDYPPPVKAGLPPLIVHPADIRNVTPALPSSGVSSLVRRDAAADIRSDKMVLIYQMEL